MSAQTTTAVQAQSKSNAAAVFQNACSCGKASGVGGSCADCAAEERLGRSRQEEEIVTDMPRPAFAGLGLGFAGSGTERLDHTITHSVGSPLIQREPDENAAEPESDSQVIFEVYASALGTNPRYLSHVNDGEVHVNAEIFPDDLVFLRLTDESSVPIPKVAAALPGDHLELVGEEDDGLRLRVITDPATLQTPTDVSFILTSPELEEEVKATLTISPAPVR
jgi:hypothetical protein